VNGGDAGRVRGARRLILFRWILIVAAGLPALSSLGGAVETTVAVRPYFADAIGRLPLAHLIRVFGEAGGSFGPMIGMTVLLALLGQQVLTAGALAWLSSDTDRAGGRGVFVHVLREGTPWIWAMLRVVLLAALVAVVGIAALSGLFDWLDDHGKAEGWRGWTMIVLLPVLRLVLTLAWLFKVGAFALWCRTVMLADGRRRVRSVALIVWRVWWRRPFSAPLRYMVVMGGATLLGAVVLVSWRQMPPAGPLIARIWLVAWMLALLVQAAAWYHVLSSARTMYAGWFFDDLRARPEGPSWLRRLRRAPREKPVVRVLPLSPDPAADPSTR